MLYERNRSSILGKLKRDLTFFLCDSWENAEYAGALKKNNSGYYSRARVPVAEAKDEGALQWTERERRKEKRDLKAHLHGVGKRAHYWE